MYVADLVYSPETNSTANCPHHSAREGSLESSPAPYPHPALKYTHITPNKQNVDRTHLSSRVGLVISLTESRRVSSARMNENPSASTDVPPPVSLERRCRLEIVDAAAIAAPTTRRRRRRRQQQHRPVQYYTHTHTHTSRNAAQSDRKQLPSMAWLPSSPPPPLSFSFAETHTYAHHQQLHSSREAGHTPSKPKLRKCVSLSLSLSLFTELTPPAHPLNELATKLARHFQPSSITQAAFLSFFLSFVPPFFFSLSLSPPALFSLELGQPSAVAGAQL